MKFIKKVEALRMGGPAGPLDIEDARDKEIEFKQGIPKLRVAVRPQRAKNLDNFNKGVGGPYESDQGSYPYILPDLLSFNDRGWPQSGRNAPTRGQPTEEKLPVKQINAKTPEADPKKEANDSKDKTTVTITPPKDQQPKEEEPVKVNESIVRPKYFTQLVGIVRAVFPQLKMAFPSPPTYIWNPAGQSKPSDEGEKEIKPLDPKDVKNKLKLKFPDLSWSKNYDSVDVADYQFPDGSRAEFAIGLDANHLTLTYYPHGQ